jgi:hypothetical protein
VSLDIALKPLHAMSIGDGDHRVRTVPVAVTVTLRNVAKQPLTILGATYTLYVSRDSARPPRSPVSRVRLLSVDDRTTVLSRSVTRAIAEHGRVARSGVALQADQTVTRRMDAFVPVGYDVVSARVEVALARRRYDTQEEIANYRWYAQSVTVADDISRINDELWLHKLTRSPRYLHVQDGGGYVLPCGATNREDAPVSRSGLHVYISRDRAVDPDRWCDQVGQLERHYGIAYTTIAGEALLPRGGKRT